MNPAFFTDRDLGLLVPSILAAGGLEVHRHHDHFRPDCPDEQWLKEIGRRRWVAITRDQRIRYKPNERAAVIRHKVRLLVLVGKATFPELAKSFVRTTPRIMAFLADNPPPVIAKVYCAAPAVAAVDPEAPGRIERWYP
ncbi:MAG: hypothetical protein ABI679_16005 [Gemmatimonadota bacterium]